MNNQKQAPEVQEAQQGQDQQLPQHSHHEVIKNLSPIQAKVYMLLITGIYSTLEICEKLRIADPRSAIRDLRNIGIAVGDVWERRTRYNPRFKRYFIRKGGNSE